MISFAPTAPLSAILILSLLPGEMVALHSWGRWREESSWSLFKSSGKGKTGAVAMSLWKPIYFNIYWNLLETEATYINIMCYEKLSFCLVDTTSVLPAISVWPFAGRCVLLLPAHTGDFLCEMTRTLLRLCPHRQGARSPPGSPQPVTDWYRNIKGTASLPWSQDKLLRE